MGLGHDPEVPAGFQDADLEQAELERAARERKTYCVACGEETVDGLRWCSGDGCRIAEDGPDDSDYERAGVEPPAEPEPEEDE